MTDSERANVSGIDRTIVRLVRLQAHSRLGWLATQILRIVGVHIHPNVRIGADLRLPHSTAGVVVHGSTRLGDRVTLLQNTTIGRGDAHAKRPGSFGGVLVGNDVTLGAGAVVLASGPEPLIIADGTIVGANAVLLSSTNPGETWVGNPAHRVSPRPDSI